MMIFKIITLNIINITDDHINSDYINFNHVNYDYFNTINSSVNKIILLNNITVYRFSEKTVEAFHDLINDYSILFIDIDFVDLSEEN